MADVITYERVWTKYLPVIVMKLKSAVRNNEPQSLNLDRYDFENAGVRKNAVLKFNVEMREGRAVHDSKATALARDFASVLNENVVAKDLVKSGHFTFSMGTKFILNIQKN